MGLNPVEREIYEAEVKANMVDQGQLEYAREQGLEQGREQGLEQGREQGREEFLTVLLQHRFSTLPEGITRRLDSLTSTQMDELGKALFDFTTLADLDEWLSRQ